MICAGGCSPPRSWPPPAVNIPPWLGTGDGLRRRQPWIRGPQVLTAEELAAASC